MSRSGYCDDLDNWDLIRWRGAVASAIRGARGQAMLRELRDALDALPEKRLAADSLVTADGECCALGSLGVARGMDLEPIDPDDREGVAAAFGVAEALAAEIMFLNDEIVLEYRNAEVEICGPVRPHWPDWGRHKRRVLLPNRGAGEQRWRYIRNWVEQNIADHRQGRGDDDVG